MLTFPGLHLTVGRPGFEPVTCRLQVQHPNHLAAELSESEKNIPGKLLHSVTWRRINMYWCSIVIHWMWIIAGVMRSIWCRLSCMLFCFAIRYAILGNVQVCMPHACGKLQYTPAVDNLVCVFFPFKCMKLYILVPEICKVRWYKMVEVMFVAVCHLFCMCTSSQSLFLYLCKMLVCLRTEVLCFYTVVWASQKPSSLLNILALQSPKVSLGYGWW